MTYLDTHSAIWLMQGEEDRFSLKTRKLINAEDDLLLSPMVLLEIENLHEIGRIRVSSRKLVEERGATAGVRLCTYPFGLVMNQAIDEKWTRDPFDRIIVAHARARNAALITKDENMRRNYDQAVW